MVWPQERLGSPPDGSLPEGYALRTFRAGDAAEHIRLMRVAGFVTWNEEQLAGAIDKCLPDGFYVIEHNASGRLVATAMANHQPLPEPSLRRRAGLGRRRPGAQGQGPGIRHLRRGDPALA